MLKSFGYALIGLKWAWGERNFKLHLISTVLVTALGWVLHISFVDWVLVLICIAMVLSLEIINTAIEKLVDMVSPLQNVQAGKIKDLAAAAVLVVSIIAIIIALIVFIPYL